MAGQLYRLIKEILQGKAEPEQLGPTWRNTMSWHAYLEAERILGIYHPWRRGELDKLLPWMREMVEAEMIKLHKLRKLGKKRPVEQAPVPLPHWHNWQV